MLLLYMQSFDSFILILNNNQRMCMNGAVITVVVLVMATNVNEPLVLNNVKYKLYFLRQLKLYQTLTADLKAVKIAAK
jgi:hypothetical protein